MPLLSFIKSFEPKTQNTDDFDKIVVENHRSVYALAYRLTHSESDAEDITQEVFMKFYKSQSSFRGSSKLSTLLYRITYNHTVDMLRKRKNIYCELKEDIVCESPEEFSMEQKIELLERAISQLGIEERTIITLFYMDDKPIEEISRIMTLSVANIKVKLHRTRKKLHKLIGEDYYE
ncbi:MAG: RNA polymerase sigma factor [Rikenellaceae bacterium]